MAIKAPPLKAVAMGGAWVRPDILLMLLETCLILVVNRLVVVETWLMLVDTQLRLCRELKTILLVSHCSLHKTAVKAKPILDKESLTPVWTHESPKPKHVHWVSISNTCS